MYLVYIAFIAIGFLFVSFGSFNLGWEASKNFEDTKLRAALEKIATTGCETGHPMCYDIAKEALKSINR